MKLLNLNAYARLMATDYNGPLLSDNSVIYNVCLKHSKQKYNLANGMLDALKSLLPANNHMKSFVDSKMGFLIGKHNRPSEIIPKYSIINNIFLRW